MKRWLTLFAGLTFLFVALPADQAEAQVQYGPQVVLFDLDELGIGARVDVGLGDTFGIEEGAFQDLFGTFDLSYLLDTGDLTMLVFNASAAIPFDIDAGVTPYAGAGINFIRTSGTFENPFGPDVDMSDTSGGLNLLGGIFFDLGTLPGFVQLSYMTTGAGGLNLGAGILFGG